MYIQKFNSGYILIFLFCCLCFAAQAQSKHKDSTTKKPLINTTGFSDFIKHDTGTGSADARLDSLRKSSSYTASDSLSDAYRKAELQYDIEAFNHRHSVFEWQLSSSKYIFIMVNIIVLVGLLLSIWQFYLPIYKMNKLEKSNQVVSKEVSQTIIQDDDKKETSVSTLKLGKDGIEITSPVIGLLIMVISIAFFFLYIRYVYPISEISHSETKENTTSTH